MGLLYSFAGCLFLPWSGVGKVLFLSSVAYVVTVILPIYSGGGAVGRRHGRKTATCTILPNKARLGRMGKFEGGPLVCSAGLFLSALLPEFVRCVIVRYSDSFFPCNAVHFFSLRSVISRKNAMLPFGAKRSCSRETGREGKRRRCRMCLILLNRAFSPLKKVKTRGGGTAPPGQK